MANDKRLLENKIAAIRHLLDDIEHILEDGTNAENETKKYLSPRDASRMLYKSGIYFHFGTIRAWAREGKIKSIISHSGRHNIDYQSLLDYVNGKKIS